MSDKARMIAEEAFLQVGLEGIIDRLSGELTAAQDEIGRLKAALRDIQLTAPNITTAIEIARAALEGNEALFPTKKICPECGQRMREGDYCDHIPF